MLRTGCLPLVSLRLGVKRAFVFASLVGLLAAPAFGQGGRSEINGTILDEGKALLPGATITATNQATGLVRTGTSGTNGRFVIPTLLPGSYAVKAEMQGFKPQSRSVTVAVGQEMTLNFTLPIGGLAEEITVAGEAPLVEVTSSKVGADITKEQIDNLPSANRSQLSLMALVPGLTPSLAPGTFEGGQYNANGRDTGSNLFLLDGVYDNDDRLGGAQGTQARVSLDTMAEFQVLTHQYTAEYGGSSGVVVNAVSRSGGNELHGRTFFYYQDESLNATDYFLKQAGEKNGEAGSKVYGFSLGGPFVKNKAFWFMNVERTTNQVAANLNFPPEAAPLAVNYSGSTDIKALNTFVRTDYQVSKNHSLSFRWLREGAPTIGENLESNLSTYDNRDIESDNDQLMNFNWTAIIGTEATNEFKVTHVKENLLRGNTQYFDDNLNFIELNGRDQFDVGSQNGHPDFTSGPRAQHGSGRVRSYVVDEVFTYVKSGWGGTHTFKTGATYSRNLARPQITGTNDNGTYTFVQNRPFNPATPTTYPTRFSIRLGEIYFDLTDWRANGYVQDKWQLSKKLTLNLGVRYDYQHITPSTKNAIAPRFGVAYDPTGSGKTLIRGGVGKFYEYQLLGVDGTLQQQALIGPAFTFDTGQDLASVSGRIPAHVCLQPSNNGGLAIISPGCRAFLSTLRNQVNAGGFINTDTATLDSDRKMGYLWSFSLGVKRQLTKDVAVSVDYIGNRGRDQTAIIDINEPVNGVRPGVNGFDPTGVLIPAAARGANFLRVLQFQTRDDLNSDYSALEVSIVKRHSNRWSGRASYTLAKARDVGSTGGGTSGSTKRFSDDLNLRSDYGRTNFDNRHGVGAGGNVNIWRGLTAGASFSYYSGYPINELVGTDTNGDRDTFDRPVKGVNDLVRPIQSPLDANGRAIRNGIDGESQLILNGRLHYIWKVRRYETGLFLEIYNLTDHVNFGNPTGNRTSRNFLVPIVVNNPRNVQLGLRFTF